MRILAVDPGYDRIGIAILERVGGKEKVVFSECFQTDSKSDFSDRLLALRDETTRVIKAYSPSVLAIEKLYFTANQKTAMGVSEAKGVIVVTARGLGLDICEFSPVQVKSAVASYGKATKAQVLSMVGKLVLLPSRKMHDDEIDAIAIGITALATLKANPAK